jgi:dTDP-4-dehydrorhamnose 3,5-epimerase
LIISSGKLSGILEIQLEPKEDERGFFMRVFDKQLFEEQKINCNWVQENHSLSKKRYTIRGLHFQFPPNSEAKLVRSINGEILDVFLDLRKKSPSFGQWGSILLSSVNKKMVYIPRGFAHGVCTLNDNCEVLYKVDNYYSPKSEGTILWNDPDVHIMWPVDKPILSEKDAKAMTWKKFASEYGGIDV